MSYMPKLIKIGSGALGELQSKNIDRILKTELY